MKNKLFILLALLGSPPPAFSGGETLAQALSGSGLGIAGDTRCELVKKYTRGDCAGGRRCFSTITADCGASRLRLELVSAIGEKEALKMMATRFTRVKMLYGGYIEYPGAITSRTEVPAGLKPVCLEKGPQGRETLYMPATEGMAYGAGAADLVKYSAAMTYRYCAAARTLWQIDIFVSTQTPREEINAVLERVACPAGARAATSEQAPLPN